VIIHVLVRQEAWCKRLPPDFYYHTYKPQPVLKEMSKGSLRQQDTALTKSKKALLEAADAIGRLIQYNSPGFMKNARQVLCVVLHCSTGILMLIYWVFSVIFILELCSKYYFER
jgi:hypothetical protein